MACLGLMLVSAHAEAQRAIRWDRVINASPSKLSASDRSRAAKLMNQINVYYGCSDTVAACLVTDPECQTARRLAGLIVRAVLAGRADSWIQAEVKHRAVSAHPFKKHAFNLRQRPRLGAPDGKTKVAVVEFADFECAFCRVFSLIAERVVRSMASQGVAFVYKHYPVTTNKQSLHGARAAYAAHQQGKFWPFHDILYKNAPRLSPADLESYAREVGIDLVAFRRVRDSQRSELVVAADKREGMRAGVQGTPTVFINGKLFRGRKDEAELRDRIEEELHLAAGGR